MIKGYKGFDKNMQCRGMQFEVGKEYEVKGKVEVCKTGIHYCENPLDVLDYYDLCDSNFGVIEDCGDTKKESDKNATNKIKIKEKLDLKGFINASFEFLWKKCNFEKKETSEYSKAAMNGEYSKAAMSGDCSQAAMSGDCSQASMSGEYSQVAMSGEYSQASMSGDNSQVAISGNDSKVAISGNGSKVAMSGDYSKAAMSGHCSQAAMSGDCSQAAMSGEYSQASMSGDYSKASMSGDNSQAAMSGHYSKIESEGKNCILANIGISGKIKGKKGDWITLAEYNKHNECVCVKSKKIDGKKIKENKWYKLENEQFIECEVL